MFAMNTRSEAQLIAARLRSSLAGKQRPYSELDDFALNETPFLNPKSMLRVLAAQGALEVKWIGEPSKTGFPEARIQSILVRA